MKYPRFKDTAMKRRDEDSGLARSYSVSNILLSADARCCLGLEDTITSRDKHLPALMQLRDQRET